MHIWRRVKGRIVVYEPTFPREICAQFNMTICYQPAARFFDINLICCLDVNKELPASTKQNTGRLKEFFRKWMHSKNLFEIKNDIEMTVCWHAQCAMS